MNLIRYSDMLSTLYPHSAGEPWLHLLPRKWRSEKNVLPFSEPKYFPLIPNPVVCIKEGDIILFRLSLFPNDRSSSHYPVYQKQHLFNSNPTWDFGAFRRLDHLIRETQLNISWFAHAFQSPGRYVFLDHGGEDRTLIVVVNEREIACDPSAVAVQPSAPYQLAKHGILKQHKLNLAPNWVAITVVLLFLSLLLFLLLVVAVVLKPSTSEPNPLKNWKPRWRSLGEPHLPPEYVLTKDSLQFHETLGFIASGEGTDGEKNETTAGSGGTSSLWLLEEFNVRTLYDKLEDQSLHLASQLGRHRSDTLSFYRGVSQRIQVFKDLLHGLDLHQGIHLDQNHVSMMGVQRSKQTSVSSATSDESASEIYSNVPEQNQKGSGMMFEFPSHERSMEFLKLIMDLPRQSMEASNSFRYFKYQSLFFPTQVLSGRKPQH
ncbi:uncharacterized protein [Pleurodeles waltl]|uniref:uncharacterized protein n=1 Tax=Pleurodeles waltl TaxID=8319 RepID=UPI0037098C97